MSIDWGQRQKHRTSVTSDDTGDPSDSDAINMAGNKWAIVDVKIAGSGSFTVTPKFKRGSDWFAGESQTTVNTSITFKIECVGGMAMFIELTSKAESPTADVWVTPYNSPT